MNIIYLSPHFPINFQNFIVKLSSYNVNILGLADEPYDNLPDSLKNAFKEYYKVNDLHNYDDLVRACGFFTHKYGKIDRIISNNEYWLETEAALRTDFNVFGVKNDFIDKIKRKSQMKKAFKNAGVNHGRGILINDLETAKKFINEVNYPVVAKPDIGVGAADTYKINNEDELINFFNAKTDVQYIMEEYITGKINSFDGLVDKKGNIIFHAVNVFSQGIMETVNENYNLYYHTLMDIPNDIYEAGKRLLKEFDVKESFFHFEFFRQEDGNLIALEVNIRPPGGLTTDMFNFSCDIDVYDLWSKVLLNETVENNYERKYFCAYVGKKDDRNYIHNHNDILNTHGDFIPHHQTMSPVFYNVMGSYAYLVRTKDFDKLNEIIKYIHETH